MVESPQPLQIQIWSIDRLVFYARNPRKNDAVVDRMCSSIREFGFKIPVLARSDGEVDRAGSATVWWMSAWRGPQGNDLERENERLRRELADRDQQIRQQADQIAEQQKQIADAEKQIAELERQLALRRQNSTNSSKPPSSDGLAGEPRERGRRKKSRRKVGGQPGHRGAHRPLIPITKVDEIRSILPEQCGHCGHALATQSERVQTAGEPRRHQVTELPAIQARTIEYQCHRVVCPECGASTREQVPKEAKGNFGPQLTALIAYLTVVCRMPRRVVEALLGQVLGIEISLGSTQKCWEEASQAVAAPCQELERELRVHYCPPVIFSEKLLPRRWAPGAPQMPPGMRALMSREAP